MAMTKKSTVKKPNLGYWESGRDWVSWRIKVPAKATYDVTVSASSAAGRLPRLRPITKRRAV